MAARLFRRSSAALASLTMAAMAAPAKADEPQSARLGYEVRDGAICPDESSFHNLVAARLGYDPFRADGRHQVTVLFRKDRGKVRARAEVQRAGTPQASAPPAREFVGDACEPLAAALATTVAMALDPLHVQAAPAPAGTSEPALPTLPPSEPPPSTVVFIERAPQAPAPVPPPPPVIVTPPPRPSGPAERVAFVGSVGGVVSFALAPTTTFGGAMELGFRYGVFSLSGEGRVEVTPVATRVDSGDRVEATIYSGALLPCLHLGAWLGCAVGRVGAFQGRAPDVVRPSLGTSAFGSVGIRAGYLISVTKILSVRAALEGAIPLVRTSLVIDGMDVWTAPPVTGGLDLAVVVTLK